MFSRTVNFQSSIQKLGSSDKNGDYDNVYYNADIINSKSTNSLNTNQDPVIAFQETRNIPIINNASNYEFSIIRIQINGACKNLPLMIPNIAIGLDDNPTLDINLTTYTIGMSLSKTVSSVTTTYYSSAPIIFVPENQTYGSANFGFLPKPPLVTQDIGSDYYFVYTYEHWVNLVNQTFITIFNQLEALVGSPLLTKVPYMTYEPANGLFNIYYDASAFGGMQALNTNDENMQLFSNNNFYGLFSSFESNFIDTDTYQIYDFGANTNEPNVYIVENKLNTNIWIPNTFTGFPTLAPSYYKMAQNYVCTNSFWNPISSIVFCSGQMPIVNENVSAPVRYGLSTTTDQLSNNFSPIIADVALKLQRAEDYTNLIFYEPSGEFRMASMLGGSNGSLTNIDIQVYYKNRLDNKLYPIRMFNYSSVSMKMLFRKKKDLIN